METEGSSPRECFICHWRTFLLFFKSSANISASFLAKLRQFTPIYAVRGSKIPANPH